MRSSRRSIQGRITLPQIKLKKIENTKDRGNIKLIFDIDLKKGADNTLTYEINNIKNVNLIPFSEDEAVQCLNDRLEAYLGSETPNAISPQVRELFPDCAPFTDQPLERVAELRGFFKKAIPLIFQGVIPGPKVQYGG